MISCPDGHPSTATDYCDVCGTPIGGPAPAQESATQCPACDAPISGRFCEACGHDSALPAPARAAAAAVAPPIVEAQPATTAGASEPTIVENTSTTAEGGAAQTVWIVTVAADHDFFDRMLARKGPDAERVEFPGYYPERRIMLQGSDFLIGKRSVSQGILPDIDLGIAPIDIGVSRAHARIHVDGEGLTITDLGSTNGTSLNGSEDLIPPKTPVPLHSGDRIHVGGWTTITVTAEPR